MLETAESPSRAAGADMWDRLAREAPAFVLAPLEARVIAANRAAAGVLGVPALARPAPAPAAQPESLRWRASRNAPVARAPSPEPGAEHALDSAMPAVVQLRRLAVQGLTPGESRIEPLVFWTAAGAHRLVCRVELFDAAAGSERVLLLVEPLDIASTADGARAAAGESVAEPPRTEPEAFDWPDGRDAALGPETAPGTDAATAATGPAEAALPDPVASAAPPLSAAAVAETADRAEDRDPRGPSPAPRTDADILKAIARQILATRAAAVSANGRAPPWEPPAEPTRPVQAVQAAATQAVPEGASLPAEADTAAAVATAADADEPEARADEAPQRAPSARRTLTRRLAHELKSPLSAIAAAAEIMKDERFGPIGDERYLGYARDIHESALHALEVIQRMLAPHVEGGGEAPDLAFVNLDLNTLAAATISAMAPLAEDAGVRLAAELAPALPLVVADATSLRQIVLNLLANALKFTPRGGVVTVATRAEIDGPLHLVVTDTGPGLPDEELARILDGEAAPRIGPRKGGGFGIGLPLVRSLAASNGAALRLAAAAAGGLEATIAFPKSRQVLV